MSPFCTGCVCVCKWAFWKHFSRLCALDKVFAGFRFTFYGSSSKRVQLVLALPWALRMVFPLLYLFPAPTFNQRYFRNNFHASACCTLTRETIFFYFFGLAEPKTRQPAALLWVRCLGMLPSK